MTHILFGECYWVHGDQEVLTRHVALWTPNRWKLDAHRGRLCWHTYCAECGLVINHQFNGSGGIPKRALDDRLVYLDDFNRLLVDGVLAKQLQLKERFPGTRYYWRYPVIDEPLDNEVLPTDPDWDGAIRPRVPLPKVE